MKRALFGLFLLCGLLMAWARIASANGALDYDEPAIMASPSTIVLAKVDTVTIHTNVPAAGVAVGSLELNGASPTSVYVDNCGCIVAKFAIDDLDLEPGQATLTLSGALKDGTSFSASDVVTVR